MRLKMENQTKEFYKLTIIINFEPKNKKPNLNPYNPNL